jgi:hypothetical protein
LKDAVSRTLPPLGEGVRVLNVLQGITGNKKGEFEVEAQFLSKLHRNNG